jgi:hypothetical protein
MDCNRPRGDCYGEQEREGDENPCMSEPRMVMDFMRTHTFAIAGAGNLVRSRRLSGSFIIRTQTGNRWIGGRNLIAGAATVDFLSQPFAVLDHDTVPCMANAPNTEGFQTL